MDRPGPRIYLTRRPGELTLPIAGRALAVVAPGYDAPPGVEIHGLDAVIASPSRFLGGGVTLVVVGLSRLMTPSNRCALGPVLHDPRAGLTRVVIDDALFVSEPWRLWWHYCCAGYEGVHTSGPWGYTDSFLAESRWRRAIEMREPDPFGVDPVRASIAGRVRGIDPATIEMPRVDVIETLPFVRDEYAALKERLFTDERSIHTVVRKLAAFAQQAAPERSVPQSSRLWKGAPVTRIVRTDLGVDTWLVGQLLDRVTLTNAIAAESLGW